MTKLKSETELLIAGPYLKNEAYPNVLYRIRSLIDNADLKVKEINHRLLTSKKQNKKIIRIGKNPIIFFLCHILILVKIILNRNYKYLYIPYPAIFLQFLLSLLPKRLKPDLIIIDAFISIYDTIVIDRKLVGRRNLLAKLLFLIERRALSTSKYVIVDTSINKKYYSSLFNLPSNIFIPIPLATDEITYQPVPYTIKKDNICRVLFVGTLIPLHGIQTIITAIEILKEYHSISFHIIGDGQDSIYVDEYASKNPKHFTWTRDWYYSELLASEISKSDICLGIFGSTAKTQRVCPYKIYHYARIGRPIITAKTEWTDSIITNGYENPFLLVDINSPRQLAEQIKYLANSPNLRQELAKKSQDFYLNHLSVCNSTKMFSMLLEDALK